MAKQPDYIQSFDGRNYLRFRRHPLITLPPGERTTPEFKAAYKVALAAARAVERPAPIPNPRRGKKKQVTSGAAPKSPKGDTVRDAVTDYMASRKFRTELRSGTRAVRRYLLLAWTEECGDRLFAQIKKADIRKAVEDRKPGTARNLLVALRDLVDLRIKAELMTEDDSPLGGIKAPPLPNKKHGLRTWEPDFVTIYRDYWPSGTAPRLAFEVLYHTGAACCDAIRLSRANVKGKLIEYTRQKTGEECFVAVSAGLIAELAACRLTGSSAAWLRTESGQPFRGELGAHSFSETFSRWARQAGVPDGYSAHGVRKRAATDDAEKGWTHTQLKAKFGWSTFAMADEYIKRVERRRVALDGADQNGNAN